MKTGRVSDIIHKRSIVLPLARQRAQNTDVVQTERKAGSPGFEMFSGSFTGHYHDAGLRSVIYAADKAFAAGMKPVGMTLALYVPERLSEKKMSEMAVQADLYCFKTLGIDPVGVSVYIDDHIDDPHYVMANAVCVASPEEDLYSIPDRGPKAGYDIVLTGWIALAAASDIAFRKKDELRTKLPDHITDRVKAAEDLLSVAKAAECIRDYAKDRGEHVFMHAASEGGILTALWDIGEQYDLGLTANGRDIPMEQEIVEVCEFYDLDPYRMDSQGCLLTAAEDGEALCEYLYEHGVEADVIGSFTDTNDRRILMDEEYRYLEPFRGGAIQIP